MLEELDQNSRRRWNWHRHWCIQSFGFGSAATFSRSLYIEGVWIKTYRRAVMAAKEGTQTSP